MKINGVSGTTIKNYVYRIITSRREVVEDMSEFQGTIADV